MRTAGGFISNPNQRKRALIPKLPHRACKPSYPTSTVRCPEPRAERAPGLGPRSPSPGPPARKKTQARCREPLRPCPDAANLFIPALLPAARRLRGAEKPQPRSPLTPRLVSVLKRKDQALARVVETTLPRSSSIPGGHGMVFTEMMPHGWCAQGQKQAPSGTIQLRGTRRLRLSCIVSSRPQRSPRSALDVRQHVQPHGRGGTFQQFWHRQG